MLYKGLSDVFLFIDLFFKTTNCIVLPGPEMLVVVGISPPLRGKSSEFVQNLGISVILCILPG